VQGSEISELGDIKMEDMQKLQKTEMMKIGWMRGVNFNNKTVE